MFPQDCHCNAHGGFTGNAIGLMGCIPCADGYYASPSTTIQPCTQCEMGFYSRQSSYSNCTQYTLTGNIQTTQNLSCMGGAVSCDKCPLTTPYTYSSGSTSIADCKKCANKEFEIDGACSACTPKCEDQEYEAMGCTQTTNRICLTCFQTECGLLEGNPGLMS